MSIRAFLPRDAHGAPGKMVLFNPPWITYAYNRELRRRGAAEAGALGASSALLRSVAPFSLGTPHTGASDPATIPFAAITHEDADMLERLVARGERVVVRLYMEAQLLPDAVSRNIIAELPGTAEPDEIVVMGGHIDSWDIGAGVIDDAGGAFVAWEVLRLMAKYNLRPRRTVRVVFWTVCARLRSCGPPRSLRLPVWTWAQNEENGARGGDQYRANRLAEIPRTSFALELDNGLFSYAGGGGEGDRGRCGLCLIQMRAARAAPQARGHWADVSGGRVRHPRRDRRAVPVAPGRRRRPPRCVFARVRMCMHVRGHVCLRLCVLAAALVAFRC
jgi:carboxypeptidase Q